MYGGKIMGILFISTVFSTPLFLNIMWTLSLLLLNDMLRCAGNKLNWYWESKDAEDGTGNGQDETV